MIAWDHAPQMGRNEAKNRVASEANRARDWGGGGGGAEPEDMPFIPQIHDIRSWYHDLIGQSAQCRQIADVKR